MNTERIETSIGFETSGVDRGMDRVERAFDRMDKAEQKAIRAQQAREAEAERKRVKGREDAIKDLERMEKEASDRRVAITEAEYKRLDALEKSRQANLIRDLKQNQIRAGINPNGNASSRVSGALGGHGGHGGLLGGNTRLIGDFLDNITGTPGWVMKLRGAEGIASHLGRAALPFAPLALLGFEAFRTASAANREMGETSKASDRLNTETAALGRTTAFANVGQGTESLSEQLTRVREQQRAERDQAAQIEETRRRMSGETSGLGDKYNPIAWMKRGIYNGMDSLRHLDIFGGAPTNAQNQQASNLRARELAGQASALRSLRTAAFGHERDTAAERLNGSSFQAQRMELELQEKREIADAKKLDADAHDVELIQQKFDIERERIDREEQAAENEVNSQRKIIDARRRGLNEVATAEIQLQEARYAKEAAIGDLAKRNAQNRIEQAQLALDVAKRETDLRKEALEEDSKVANSRGNADERAVDQANAEQNKAHERYDRLKADFEAGDKGVTKEQLDQARVQRDAADTARIMLNRDQRSAQAGDRLSDFAANRRFAAEASTLGHGQVDQRRAALEAEVDIAEKQRQKAQEILDIQGASLANKRALKDANEAVANSLLHQKQYELELSRTRRVELGNAQAETASMRLANSGRSMEASMLSSRRQSEVAQYEALRENNPEMAAELAKQQQARETGAYLDKFYNADGTKKDRGRLNREEAKARQTEGRRNRAASRFERDLGLIDVRRDMGGNVIGGVDPFTHQHVTAAQVRERMNRPAADAAKDKASGSKTLADIYQLLDQHLPKN